MMIRIVSMSYIAAVAALIFGLYHVKLDTRTLERQKQALSTEIVKTDSDIRILQAEWADRTSPDYLKRLVTTYLPDMRPTEPSQLASLDKVPMRAAPSDNNGDEIERLLSMVELRPSGAQGQQHPRPTL